VECKLSYECGLVGRVCFLN